MNNDYENNNNDTTLANIDEFTLGIDIGSTTVKLAIVDPISKQLLYSKYQRHNTQQIDTLCQMLNEAAIQYPNAKFRIAVCGSGGKPVATVLQVPYIQEVVANAAAIQACYPQARTAIELGGQDAKIIFFYYDTSRQQLQISDMRMNGSCAGGTGAFIDEVASLLYIPVNQFDALAKQGNSVFDISGRCGVFAKTDIQPLLIQGVLHEDIALSTFHAIARQTIGGLAQGLTLEPPIVFEGGPLTFNPTLIKVFAERLHLTEQDILIPEHPETIVAFGTAIAMPQLFPKESSKIALHTLIEQLQSAKEITLQVSHTKTKPFFSTEKEKKSFLQRHEKELLPLSPAIPLNGKLPVYIGIDSGSTTSKIVLLDTQSHVIDSFYANNHGDAILVIRDALLAIQQRYAAQGIILQVLGLGTTGYGEKLMAKAFGADYHTVETVAHAQSCKHFYPNASFLLDIGGQDMKAIWLKDGIISNIMLNEACSSGCGSFLENFATNLQIPVDQIATAAFRSTSPAELGSRCTVFMNSTIIHEQRCGKQPNDLMAGLCRSIIKNVFTKVVRLKHPDELGAQIIVQGGTFRNMAVLRAIEEYLDTQVTLAPYPGEMGALGVALLTKQHIAECGYNNKNASTFIGFGALSNFDFTTKTGIACNGCNNHCNRTIMEFSNGTQWITGNRCEKGSVNTLPINSHAIDLFSFRETLLFQDYPYQQVSSDKQQTIGLPRILEFWDSMPFWSTFFHALGYHTVFSQKSNRKLYEQGLQYVASDTVCFPAKLVHGHIMNLAQQHVDRIFMPYIMHMPPEGTDSLSPYVCSIVMGYPMVIHHTQSPDALYQIPFDTPVFHWFNPKNRKTQICAYAVKTLHVTQKEAEAAFSQGEQILLQFRKQLQAQGQQIIKHAMQNNTFAIVLAGRPYHNDPFICHTISKQFAEKGISVLTVDSLPGINQVDLKNTNIEITNNYHTRMLSAAMIVAEHPELEYVQIVSFGCGHDAVLSDEIIRILTERSNKVPLILKMDESDASGALSIRIQSFLETILIRKKMQTQTVSCKALPTPNPLKFTKADKKQRILLIPNISIEVSKLLSGILKKENYIVETVPIGTTEQIHLGKKYVHNDICFPCQMVIGELISALQKKNCSQNEIAVGMVKFQCDCRMSHYAGLLRKGLDAAGFSQVPILTTDANDTKDMHPNIMLLGPSAILEAVWTFMMLDILTDLCRKIRPYELHIGETNCVYQRCVDEIADAIQDGISSAKTAFIEAIDAMQRIPYDRSIAKPRVLITGELLVTYHSGSNFNIESYMEQNGMETIFPRITDQLRKDFLASMAEIKEFKADIPPYPFAVNALFDHVQKKLEQIAVKHPLYQRNPSPKQLYKGVSDIIPETLSCGEGWLMAAEIAHYAQYGVKAFVILQPFGCLPNHICGRGVIKRLKEQYPDIQILPLDLDPDTSFANIENRLQMLLMNKGHTNK